MPRKTITLAFAGAGARAVIYFGILDVFDENGIPVDFIAACSSGAIVACAYASGTHQQLKQRAFNLDRKELLSLFEPSFNGGLFSFEKVLENLREYIKEPNLEDLKIPVAIVASDLVHGEEVIFTIGDTMRAIQASCTMPGLFEPVVWGNKILLDGGLFSIIPVEAAKQFNSDIIIGVDLAKTRNLFGRPVLHFKRGYNFLVRPLRLFFRLIDKIQMKIFDDGISGDAELDQVKTPNLLSVMDRAMDYAMRERQREEYFNCDIIIKPDVSNFKDIELKKDKIQAMYQQGREAARLALPKIKELLEQK